MATDQLVGAEHNTPPRLIYPDYGFLLVTWTRLTWFVSVE